MLFFDIKGNEIEDTKFVKQLNVDIDGNLTLGWHISHLCMTAVRELNPGS